MKPFLKWAGGKTQIMGDIISLIPDTIGDYYEPFVGGGSVLLAILSLQSEGRLTITGTVYASDANAKLINLYKCIQNDYNSLARRLQYHIHNYHSCSEMKGMRKPSSEEEALSSKESYYYWMRSEFNRSNTISVESATLFLMLNKTGFRGLYRESKNGFNIPFGHYASPKFPTSDELRSISELLQGVVFRCCDFRECRPSSPETLVYLDPPYAPETSTSFVGYTKEGFQHHQELFDLIDRLSEEGVRVVLSNARVLMVMTHFSGERYTIREVECKRRIHSKRPNATTMEVLITNY